MSYERELSKTQSVFAGKTCEGTPQERGHRCISALFDAMMEGGSINIGYGTAEGHDSDGDVHFVAVVGVMVNDGAHAFSPEEARMLAKSIILGVAQNHQMQDEFLDALRSIAESINEVADIADNLDLGKLVN